MSEADTRHEPPRQTPPISLDRPGPALKPDPRQKPVDLDPH